MLVKAAQAKDGRTVAVVMVPRKRRFLIRVQRSEGDVVLVHVDLQGNIPGFLVRADGLMTAMSAHTRPFDRRRIGPA